MVANYQSNCENIDSRWKADILYKMWHRSLDWDWDWIACENLPYNKYRWNVWNVVKKVNENFVENVKIKNIMLRLY